MPWKNLILLIIHDWNLRWEQRGYRYSGCILHPEYHGEGTIRTRKRSGNRPDFQKGESGRGMALSIGKADLKRHR